MPTVGCWWSHWGVMAASHCHLWWRSLSTILWVVLSRWCLHSFLLVLFWFVQNWHNSYLQSVFVEFFLQSHREFFVFIRLKTVLSWCGITLGVVEVNLYFLVPVFTPSINAAVNGNCEFLMETFTSMTNRDCLLAPAYLACIALLYRLYSKV